MRSCFHQLALEKYLPSPDSESLTDNFLSPSISWPWPTIFWACLADPSILKFSLLSTLGWYLPYFIVFLRNNNLYTINMEFLFLLIEGGMNSPRFLKTWQDSAIMTHMNSLNKRTFLICTPSSLLFHLQVFLGVGY